jgi:hypothetical protein
MDDRIDISFSFALDRELPGGSGKSGLFELHFMSIAGLCRGRFMAAFGNSLLRWS